jgi:hypothetical protein
VRAIERGGKLLEQEKREKGRTERARDATAGTSSLKAAIAEAGLSSKEARTMINVARVPAEKFEELVERPKPATISQLALLGTKQRERRSATLVTVV